jgi:hypothetical protein
MLRLLAIALVVLSAPAALNAESWTDRLFEEKTRDFGTVPQGPLLTHPFRLTNMTGQPVHVANVRVSCGCVTASVLKDTLAPGETTVVLAQMDTRRFVNSRSVVIFVLFDRPALFEDRLTLTANSQTALTVNPETVSFGQVKKGDAAETKGIVSFRGDPNWQITGLSSSSTFVEPALVEKSRTNGEVSYELTVRLKPGVPVGRWYSDIWLTTSNPATPRIHVPVGLEIKAPLTLIPGPAQFGNVVVGQSAERKVLVQGLTPFRIVNLQGGEGSLTAAVGSSAANQVQVITIRWQPTQTGALETSIQIVTDLPVEGVVELPVRGIADLP